jgi:hypothetical protein
MKSVFANLKSLVLYGHCELVQKLVGGSISVSWHNSAPLMGIARFQEIIEANPRLGEWAVTVREAYANRHEEELLRRKR